MIDLAALQSAVEAALRGSQDLQALFPAGRVAVFDVPPVNFPPPYLVIGEDDLLPIRAEGFTLGEVSANVHIWSLPDPPSKTEAKAMGAVIIDLLVAAIASPGLQIYAAELERERYLTDPSDSVTTHGVVTLSFTTAPAQPTP